MFKKLNTKGGLKGHLSKVVAVVAAVAITFTSVGFTSFATNSDENSAAVESSAAMENTDTQENSSEENSEDTSEDVNNSEDAQEQENESNSEESEEEIIVVSDDESDAASEASEEDIIVEYEDDSMSYSFDSLSEEDSSLTDSSLTDSSSDSSSSEASGSGTESDPIVTDTYSKLEVGTLSKLYDVLSEALKVSNLDGEITAATAENASDLFEVKKIVVENGEPKKDDNGYVFAGDDAAAGTYDWFVITNKAFSTTGPAILVKVTKTATDNTKTDTFYRVPVTAKKASPKITVKEVTYDKTEQEVKKEDVQVVIDGVTLSTAADNNDYSISAGTTGQLKATNAGTYSLSVTFGGSYSDYEAQKVEWVIKKAELDCTFMWSCSVAYGSKASLICDSIKSHILEKKLKVVTISDKAGTEYDLTSFKDFSLVLLNSDGTEIEGTAIPNAGVYKMSFSADSFGDNYAVGKVTYAEKENNDGSKTTLGLVTIKAGSAKGTVTWNTSSVSYGTTVKANVSSSQYTKMTWVLKKGESATGSLTTVSSNETKTDIAPVSFNNLTANTSNEKYFLFVTFSDIKSNLIGSYEDKAITVTSKELKVNPISINGYAPSKKVTQSYTYTGSNITPDYKKLVKSGSSYLTLDTEYELDSSKTSTTSASKSGTYYVYLKGKAPNYTGNITITWTIKSSTANTSSKSSISVTKESGVTTTVQSASSSGIANYATSKKETGKTKLFTLNIKAINKNNMDYETSTLVEKITDEYVNAYSGASESDVVVDCIDITVHELTKDSDGNIEKDEDLSELDKIIDIGLTVGKTNAAKTIRLVREHNGSAAEMTKLTSKSSSSEGFYVDEDNGKIYIYSSKFSNYTIVYLPNKAKEAASNSSTRSLSSSDDSDVNGARAPKTGDTLPVVWVWALVLLGGVVVTSYAVYGSLTANKVKTKNTKKNERTLN